MALRLHSRLLIWNLLLTGLVSFLLSFLLSPPQLALIIVAAVVSALISAYGVQVLIQRPLHKLSVIARKLAAGNLSERSPIAGDEAIAALGASLNSMAQTLGARMQALADDKQQLELILGAMGQGVMVLDRSGRITLANPALIRVLGAGRDLIGKTPLEVFRRPEIDDAVKSVLRGESVETIETTIGSNRVLQANVAPVTNGSGVLNSAVVVFNDLTEIRRTERMRRDFVANVSHEFKTPLTSIRGYTETLLSGAKDEPNVTTDFLKIIERNSHTLEALVSDLLMLAKLEAELPSTKEQFELKSVIREQIASRKNALDERAINVQIDCPDLRIRADRSRLGTALSNLIDNAIQYNKPAGQIHVAAEAQNGLLKIEVTDTGYGIPAEELPRIFERFYRVDKARARESGGTGLGLSIVKHAIESQGGTITVASRIGAGSTFTIRLSV